MKTLTRCLVVVAGGFVLLFLLTATNAGQAIAASAKPSLVEVINTSANPVPVTAGPTAADHVQLEYFFTEPGTTECPLGAEATQRIMPDGARTPFAVPAGKVLVLTDIEGEIRETAVPFLEGEVGRLEALTGTGDGLAVAASAQINAAAVQGRIVTMEVHLESGVIAAPGSVVCLRASAVTNSGSSTAGVRRARLQGHLMNE